MKRAYDIVKTMDEQSTKIYRSKKAALEKGDESVVHQMSEGKDIMSILCEWEKSPGFMGNLALMSYQ